MADEKDKAQKPKKEPRGERQGKKGGDGAGGSPAEAKPREPEVKVPARLRMRYEQEIRPALMRELKIENVMRAPRLEKIVINMALNEARDNAKILDAAVEELKLVACATFAASATRPSTGAATIRSACASTRFSPSSTWTRSSGSRG